LAGAASCTSSGGSHSSDGEGPLFGGGKASASASGRPALPAQSRFTVPKGFDNKHGWTEAVTSPQSRTHGSWVVAPHSGVFVQAMNNDGKVHARSLDGGRQAWTFSAPTAMSGASTDIRIASDTDGEEIVVIVRDGRTENGPLLTVDTVHATATGTAKAIRHYTYAGGEVGDFAGGLLITQRAESRVVALDPVTGKERRVGQRPTSVKLPRCREQDMPPGASCSAEGTAQFMTAAGPVSSFEQSSYCDFRWKPDAYLPCADGFAVGTAWNTGKVAPKRAASATPLAVAGGYIVVDWTLFPDARTAEGSKKDVVAVHDLDDGELVAQVACDITDPAVGNGSVRELAAQSTTQLSPSGEYLDSGQVGFDLAAKRGSCFAGSAKSKGITLTAVDDSGRAFGVTRSTSRWADTAYGAFPFDFGTEEEAVPTRVVETDLRTGVTTPQPKNTAVPVFTSKDTGLFQTSGTLAAYPAVSRRK
jgi:hypothetical protein